MSKITGRKFGELFKLRVVSGMLVDGSIQVTWATGEAASSQMDWGLTPDNLSSTPEYNFEPEDMVRYHRLWFPVTYLDARHYFRARSRNKEGKITQSRLYYVITPDGVKTQTNPFSSEIELQMLDAATDELVGQINAITTAIHRHDPISSSQKLFSDIADDVFIDYNDQAETSNARTRTILNIS